MLKICERKLQDIDDVLDESKVLNIQINNQAHNHAISDKEWSTINEPKKLAALSSKKLQSFKYENLEKESLDKDINNIKLPSINNYQKVEKTSDMAISEFEKEQYIHKAVELLKKIEKKDKQYYINGEKNIWILKPARLSRGRGIKCISSLSEITNFKSNNYQYVIQKYIENPLIIYDRKVIKNL